VEGCKNDRSLDEGDPLGASQPPNSFFVTISTFESC
jgi:hypothetical protein